MAETSHKEIKLFYCYAREDKSLRDELEKHLSWLRRRYHLTNWHDREILPGEEWEHTIDTHLNTAQLILLLISPDFMASDYCYGKEMQRALQRHQEGSCRVIPILLRPTYWEEAPFSILQILPPDARPVTRWPDRDEAFHDVVREIDRVIKNLLISLKTKEEWLKEGYTLFDLKRYEEALAAYEQAIRLKPDYAEAYRAMGVSLNWLKRYEESIAACEQAIRLKPNYAEAYREKSKSLNCLKRYEEALATDEQAIRLKPDYAEAYCEMGANLSWLNRYEEALATCEQAIRLKPDYAEAYCEMGANLSWLNRYEEALAAYEQAIRLKPDYAEAYYGMGVIFEQLRKRREAQQAYTRAKQLGYSS